MTLQLKSMGTGSPCCSFARPASGRSTRACGRLAQRSLARTCTRNAAHNPETPDETGGRVGIYEEIDTLRFLVKNDASDHTLASFLRRLEKEARLEMEVRMEKQARLDLEARMETEVRLEKQARLDLEARMERLAQLEKDIGDYREKIARLEGDTEVLKVRMEHTMAAYLELLGLLSMRGILEYIQRTMPDRTKITWNVYQPKQSWQAYVDERPTLQACLAKRQLPVANAGKELSDMYKVLSEKIHDSKTPAEYQQSGGVLYIGPPLVQKQRELMACLCDDIFVPYKFMEAVVGSGDGD